MLKIQHVGMYESSRKTIMKKSAENNADFEKGIRYRIVATKKPLNERYIFYDKAAAFFHKAFKSLYKVNKRNGIKCKGMWREHKAYSFIVKAELCNNSRQKILFFKKSAINFKLASENYKKANAKRLMNLCKAWHLLSLSEYFLSLGFSSGNAKIKRKCFNKSLKSSRNSFYLFRKLQIKKLENRSLGLNLMSKAWLTSTKEGKDKFLESSKYLEDAAKLYYLREWKEFKYHLKGWAEWFRGQHYMSYGMEKNANLHFLKCRQYFIKAKFDDGIKSVNMLLLQS